MPYPPGQAVVKAALSPLARTVQSTPPSFDPPLIQVRRIGGIPGRIDDQPIIEVQFFAVDYPAALELAKQGETIMETLYEGGRVHDVDGYPNGVFVDKVAPAAPPLDVTYEDTAKRRHTAAYRLVIRKQS